MKKHLPLASAAALWSGTAMAQPNTATTTATSTGNCSTNTPH
ncbi:MAG: hypothetical protein M0006_09640 [Magnetospirillum sp.]|nr:hypothetical protein [Magnetospirillum sp.]